jgi:uncharacterized membrane protein YfcA
MYELTTQTWIIAVLCVAILGMAKAGIPGLGMIAIPVMAGLFPPKVSMGILLPLLVVGDVFAVSYYHRHADWGLVRRLIPPAFTGVIIGAVVMREISDSALRIGVGVIILVMVTLNALRSRGIISDACIPRGRSFSIVMGLFAGVSTMLAHAAGPVVQVYLLTMGLSKNRFIGTMAWFFLLLNSFKIPFYIGLGLINHESLLLNLRIAVGIPLGIIAGVLVVRVLSNRIYIIWVQLLAAAAALRLIFA